MNLKHINTNETTLNRTPIVTRAIVRFYRGFRLKGVIYVDKSRCWTKRPDLVRYSQYSGIQRVVLLFYNWNSIISYVATKGFSMNNYVVTKGFSMNNYVARKEFSMNDYVVTRGFSMNNYVVTRGFSINYYVVTKGPLYKLNI